MKRFLIPMLFPFIVGCATQDKRKQELMASYSQYSCPLLHQKYEKLKAEKEDAENTRGVINAANVAIGALGMLSGRGTINYYGKNSAENMRDEEMQIIEQTAIDKKCTNLSFK
jgi:hypothetical protein